MTETQAHKNNSPLIGQKSIPELIIDGSIGIDSIEAFSTILKQFPDHPGLVKKYSDLLLQQDLLDLAEKSYEKTAQLCVESGKLLQSLVAKKLQWRIKRPSNKDILHFLSILDQESFNDSQLKLFIDKLSAKEILAFISSFVKTPIMAGQTVKKAGDIQTDLYFVVSGTLKDSAFPSLETKEKVYRKANINLTGDDFFGEIYPFNQDHTCTSDIEAVTQVELVKISKPKLVKLCRDYPNIEMALIDLFNIRSKPEKKNRFKTLRRADRYPLPIKMVLEISPIESAKDPIAIEGYSSDISIGGICVVLNGKSEHVLKLLNDLLEDDHEKQIWACFRGDTMELKVRGTIAWRHPIVFNGRKTLAVGFQFEKDIPKMRGMLFMFAKNLASMNSASESQ